MLSYDRRCLTILFISLQFKEIQFNSILGHIGILHCISCSPHTAVPVKDYIMNGIYHSNESKEIEKCKREIEKVKRNKLKITGKNVNFGCIKVIIPFTNNKIFLYKNLILIGSFVLYIYSIYWSDLYNIYGVGSVVFENKLRQIW